MLYTMIIVEQHNIYTYICMYIHTYMCLNINVNKALQIWDAYAPAVLVHIPECDYGLNLQ